MKRLIKSLLIVTLLISFVGCEEKEESSIASTPASNGDSVLTLSGSGE